MQKIISNKIQCKHCNEIIESKTTHNFVMCKCNTCGVDGGHSYLRRTYKHSPEQDFIELSELETE